MQETKDLKDLNPREGDLILLLNTSINSYDRSALGIFDRTFVNDFFHDAFSFKEGIEIKPKLYGIVPIIHGTQKLPWDKNNWGNIYPVRTDLSGFSREDSSFYKGEKEIIEAIRSSHLSDYLPIITDYITHLKKIGFYHGKT